MRAFVRARFALSKAGPASALLVDDEGRIAAVGPDDEIAARAGRGAGQVDLGGGVVLPAFRDAHVHLCQLGRYLIRPDLGRTKNLGEAFAEARSFRDRKRSGPLFLEGYDESLWREGRPPRRSELDAIEAGRPLLFRRVCGHIAVANRAALETIPEGTAGVDRTSGLLEEEVVFRLEEDFFPPAIEENREAILRAEAEAFALGIAAVHEIDHPGTAEAYRSLDAEGRLRLRVRFYARSSPEEAARLVAQAPGRRFRAAGLKVFLDGSIGGRTAALREPYAGGGNGTLLLEPREIDEALRAAEALGLQIAFHAIGDRSADLLLGAIERRRAAGGLPMDHRIEHAEMISDEGLDRVRALGLRLSMQPNFPIRWGGPGGMYEARLGAGRARRLNRFASVLARGIPLAFGSDCMPLDPFYGLEGAISHPVSEERIAPGEAIRCYAGSAEAFAPGGERAGSLAPGETADFIVLEAGTSIDGPIGRERLLCTVASGETVYER